MITSLNALAPGDRCVVEGVTAVGQLGQRLLDLGILPGKPVLVVRDAPLFDPLYLLIDDCRVSVRREEAAQVEVRRVE